MPNDRLRDALLRHGLDISDVATATGVDQKTVERWITKGRAPYPRHRHTVAAMVRESESYLWPDALTPDRAAEVSTSEVVTVYPHRHQLPPELWSRLVESTANRVDILVYAGMFLTDNPGLLKKLREKARNGMKVRILFGDPECDAVERRSVEEGIGSGTIAAKIKNVVSIFAPIADEPGIDIRLHDTTLYNSIFRFDDEMLVNMHVLGHMAPHSPTMHLRQLAGGSLFELYAESFESVWESSTAIPSEFLPRNGAKK